MGCQHTNAYMHVYILTNLSEQGDGSAILSETNSNLQIVGRDRYQPGLALSFQLQHQFFILIERGQRRTLQGLFYEHICAHT